jgi:hypothetical protein
VNSFEQVLGEGVDRVIGGHASPHSSQEMGESIDHARLRG